MSHVDQILAAAKRYRRAVRAEVEAIALYKGSLKRADQIALCTAEDEAGDAMLNLLEVAGRLG